MSTEQELQRQTGEHDVQAQVQAGEPERLVLPEEPRQPGQPEVSQQAERPGQARQQCPTEEPETAHNEATHTTDGAVWQEASEAQLSAQQPAQQPAPQQPSGGGFSLPAHFEVISPERLKKAKRTKIILILVIILLLLALFGAAAAGIYYYLNYIVPQGGQEQGLQATTKVITGTQVQDRGVTEAQQMPALVGMFGKTPEEALALLGSDYAITNVDIIQQSPAGTSGTDTGQAAEGATAGDATTAGEGTAAAGSQSAAGDTTAGSEGAAAGDATTAGEGTAAAAEGVEGAVATERVRISYTPKGQDTKVASTVDQRIYLTLDAHGKIMEIYFASTMNLLDFPISSFAELTASFETVSKALGAAGGVAAASAAYVPPTEAQYTLYVDPDATNKKIKTETTTVQGTLIAANAPTNFELTFTYDYGATGQADTPSRQPDKRMLYLKLW